MICLGMFIIHHRTLGRRFQVRPPLNRRARNYLNSQNFWERFGFDWQPPSYSASRGHLTSFEDIVQIGRTGDVGNEVGDRVRDLLSRDPYDALRNIDQVGDLVSELVDNFAQHSEASHAACVLQRYPKIGLTDFAIGDCGIGIRESLSQNKEFERLKRLRHREAARIAFRMRASRRAEGGMGLPEVMESVEARVVSYSSRLATGGCCTLVASHLIPATSSATFLAYR